MSNTTYPVHQTTVQGTDHHQAILLQMADAPECVEELLIDHIGRVSVNLNDRTNHALGFLEMRHFTLVGKHVTVKRWKIINSELLASYEHHERTSVQLGLSLSLEVSAHDPASTHHQELPPMEPGPGRRLVIA